MDMEKFVNASDLFLRRINNYIDLFSSKFKQYLKNVFLHYISLIIILFFAIFYRIRNYNGIQDALIIGLLLFIAYLLLVVIGKIYYSLKNKKIEKDQVEVQQNSLPQNDVSHKDLMIQDIIINEDELLDYYHHNNKKSKIRCEKISNFHNLYANKYFDIVEVKVDFFIHFIFENKKILMADRIELKEELSNTEIAKFLDGLKEITGIPRSKLGMLFKKRIKSTGKYKKVNELSLNSSISQANSYDKC